MKKKGQKMDKAEKREKGFKEIFMVLMVVLLALTFLSKSLYNYRLPVVTAEFPVQGRLSFTVEGTSEFTYAYTDSVYADVDGKIRNILVKEGDEVKKGQLLMSIELSGTGDMYDVKAKVNGIISWIGIKNGMYVSSMQNTILYEIAKKSDEWLCPLLISEEQYENISMESIPVLEIVNRNETVEGKINSIISYTGQDIEGYKVNIIARLAGDSPVGERVNVTVKEDGRLYDTLIPATALCKDSAGYYVLVLQKNDSVIGEGYKACRISVDLLDSDESYCAVRGLPMDELVIISSTSEIANGSNVFYEGDDIR